MSSQRSTHFTPRRTHKYLHAFYECVANACVTAAAAAAASAAAATAAANEDIWPFGIVIG